jgi:hypothetical protein
MTRDEHPPETPAQPGRCRSCNCIAFDYEVGDHPGRCNCGHFDSDHQPRAVCRICGRCGGGRYVPPPPASNEWRRWRDHIAPYAERDNCQAPFVLTCACGEPDTCTSGRPHVAPGHPFAPPRGFAPPTWMSRDDHVKLWFAIIKFGDSADSASQALARRAVVVHVNGMIANAFRRGQESFKARAVESANVTGAYADRKDIVAALRDLPILDAPESPPQLRRTT